MYSKLILNSSANATLFELPNAKQVYLSAIQEGAYEKLGRDAIILSVITWTSACARGMADVG
jgi:hypothetical protein